MLLRRQCTLYSVGCDHIHKKKVWSADVKKELLTTSNGSRRRSLQFLEHNKRESFTRCMATFRECQASVGHQFCSLDSHGAHNSAWQFACLAGSLERSAKETSIITIKFHFGLHGSRRSFGWVSCLSNHGVWGWVIFEKGTSPFDLSVIFAINVFSVNVSFGHMFLLTVDRLFAVVKPLRYRVIITNKRAVIASCVCWIYFLAFGCSFLMLRDYFAVMGAVYNVQLLSILVSMLIMYTVIAIRLRRYSKTRMNKPIHSPNSLLVILQREKRLFKAITIVICAFLICYMPWFIVQLLIYLCKPCHPHLALLMIFFGFSGTLTYTNSGLNPILYSWRLPRYRETFKYLWKKRALKIKAQTNKNSSEEVKNTKL